MKRRPTSLPGSGVVRRERVYRIVLGGPPPADLAARCSGVWRELLDIAERNRGQQHDPETQASDAFIGTPEERPVNASSH